MADRIKSQTVNITAGQQFGGTEFSPNLVVTSNRLLVVKQILLKMGSESKQWLIYHRFGTNPSTAVKHIVLQSTSGGVPGANTDTDVFVSGADAEMHLISGSQVQFQTIGATAAMTATLIYEEVELVWRA